VVFIAPAGMAAQRQADPAEAATGGGDCGFRTPTLVIVAGRSRQNNPKRLKQLAHTLPDVRVATLPAATHYTLPQEYPIEVGAAIIELLGNDQRAKWRPAK
jgi:hypothetical protein